MLGEVAGTEAWALNKKNPSRANVFLAGVANFGKAMYRSLY